jgi:hypothetical protein
MKKEKESSRFVNTSLMAFFSFSIILAIFWGGYSIIEGRVPNGYWGLSRWWDLAINPIWLVLFLLVMGFLADEKQPSWAFIFLTPIVLVLWVFAGLVSIVLGLAVLFWPFVILFPLLFVLQIRLAYLSIKGRNAVYKGY